VEAEASRRATSKVGAKKSLRSGVVAAKKEAMGKKMDSEESIAKQTRD
jgi:hypothetical protein